MRTGDVRIRVDNRSKQSMRTIRRRRDATVRRRGFALFVICLACFLFSMFHTSEVRALTTIVPDKRPILDLAELLTSAEVETLQKELEHVSFSFYLVTITSLDGSRIESFGQQLFQEWSLAGNDVLFIISSGDREAHMEIADESVFVRLIEQDPALQDGNPYARFIDQTFIPHAINGDFYSGIMQLVKQLEERKTNVPNRTVPAPPSPNERIVSPERNSSPLAIIIFAVLAVLLFVIIGWRQRQKFANHKRHLKEKHRATLAEVHRIEQELTPTIQFSKGESERLLRALQQRFYDLLQASTAYVREVESLTVPWIVSRKAWQHVAEVEQKVTQFADTAKKLKEELAEYKKIESEAVRSVADYTREWEKWSDQLTKHAKDSGYSLDRLWQKGNDLKKIIDQASQLVEFDPLQVKNILQDVPDLFNEFKQSIEKQIEHANIYAKFPERLQRLTSIVKQTIENERLLLVEIDPYGLLDRMETTVKQWSQPIQDGDVRRSEHLVQQLDRLEQEIKDQLSRTIQARTWIGETLRIAMEQVSKYDDNLIVRFEQQLKEVQQTYEKNHWLDIPEQIEQIKDDKQKIVQELPQISHLAQYDVQKYFSGEQMLREVMARLQQMESTSNEIIERKRMLDQSFDEQLNVLKRLGETLVQCEQQLRSQSLPHSEKWFQRITDFKREVHHIGEQAQIGLRDVTALKQRVQRLEQQIEQLRIGLQNEIQQYLKAEEARNAFSQSFSRSFNTSGSYINRNVYRRRYEDLIQEMNRSISIGDYALVHQCLETGNLLIAQMQREYETNLQRARERERQRMMRAAQAQMMRNQARRHTGFGGSSSSRSRGGSSSWGSRGGSSSFGSRSGGSRGGSSSFGSSRGSRGGKSKW